jgi:hypothetical protein
LCATRSPGQHALISLLALNGLRVSETTGADIEQQGLERRRCCSERPKIERPVAFQPCADRVVEHGVQRRLVRADPGPDDRAAALVPAGRRVDVDAADDFARGGAEHGVGESAAPREVLRVALEIAQVLRQAHLVRPVTPGESRGCLDVAGAGRPGGVVRGVVLGPERFQPHFPGREPAGNGEIGRDEQLITHQAMLAARARCSRAPPQLTSQATAASGQPPSPPMAAVMFRETYGATQFRLTCIRCDRKG